MTTAAEIRPESYEFLRDCVYSEVGIVIGDDKHYLLENRLGGIAGQLGLKSINDLCTALKEDALKGDKRSDVRRQVAEAMTTNETYFFRHPTHYRAIREQLIPQLVEQRSATRKMNFWSAAASTGQEIYSLAMLLREHGLSQWNLRLLGTDFSSQALNKARAGTYLQIEVNRGLPAPMLVKYFLRQGLKFQLKDQVRDMVRFAQIDLRKPMRAFGPFDAVFCRNVLIYFDAKTRRAILEEIHGTLFRGGWLLLGSAEAPSGMEALYERRQWEDAVYYVAR